MEAKTIQAEQDRQLKELEIAHRFELEWLKLDNKIILKREKMAAELDIKRDTEAQELILKHQERFAKQSFAAEAQPHLIRGDKRKECKTEVGGLEHANKCDEHCQKIKPSRKSECFIYDKCFHCRPLIGATGSRESGPTPSVGPGRALDC